MKILLIISSLLTVAVAQQPSVNCNYIFIGNYACFISINNPDGFNNFTEIGGTHLDGYTNADVEVIFNVNSETKNVPSIICETFPNVESFMLPRAGITEVDGNAFAMCSRVTSLMLNQNRISSIPSNAFVYLPDVVYMTLDWNFLETLPEDIFANQQKLVNLHLAYMAIEDIPDNVFRPLESLEHIELKNNNLNTFNNQWFAANERLSHLSITYNRITLSADSLVGLNALQILDLGDNLIDDVLAETFAHVPNLQSLYLHRNNISNLQADSFGNLQHLTTLTLYENPFEVIPDGAFRGLGNLTTLGVSFGRVRQLHTNSFEGLENLVSIDLGSNEIEELPQGVFVPLANVNNINLWNNRLRTIRRNIFGSLTNLETLNLDGNKVNAFDTAIINDAVNLTTLQFLNNNCASGHFGNFQDSKNQFLFDLDRCFLNFRFIVDVTTEGDEEFSFFEAPQTGFVFRVNTATEVQISLTPFNFIWDPVIEILIGTVNNTRTEIRMNQETRVAVPTPNILTSNEWNDFRVTWEHHIVLIYRGNDTYPFIAFTMQTIFPVNFYGLRAVETASWSVEPIYW